jgi:carboxyl-terminal processing protease
MRGKVKYIVLSLLGVAIIALFAAAGKPDGFRMGRSMEILVNLFRELTLYYVDEPDADKLLSDAANGMTQSLDPYTEYISEEDMASFETMTTGRYGGIGSLIRQKGDWVLFAEPYKGSPADKAGIVIGDKIVEIEGKDARRMTTAEVSETLRGEAGTTISLTIEKFFTGERQSLKIEREIISLPGIPYYGMMSDSIGYILHSDFTDECSNDMRNAIMDLKAQGAKSLILDYRSNGGGILQEAVKILSFFVPKGTEVVSMRGRSEETSATFLTQNEPLDTEIPIAVLVNGGSASAAEIVSGALQDLDRAVLLGRRTFGKGLVQSPMPLGYNTYVKLTTAKYYLPSGRCIQAIDYATRGEDGSISHIPDSLIMEFKTAGGRKVFDGGGVTPDITLEAEYVSRFAYIVYGRNYIAEFVDDYMLRNVGNEIDTRTFALTDEDWADFVSFMADKDVEWESETKQMLKLLRERATQERYIETIGKSLDELEALLHDDKDANLQLHREELSSYIEGDIVLRRGYSQAVADRNVLKDPEVKAAIDLLNDTTRYNMLLEPVGN